MIDYTDPSYHAPLSASKAVLWIPCTPSARLNEALPEDTDDRFSRPGSFKHALAAARTKHYLELGTSDHQGKIHPEEIAIQQTPEWREYINGEVNDHVNGYVRRNIIAIGQMRQEDPDCQVLVEERVWYTDWVKEGSGVVDLCIIGNGKALVRDLKTGQVRVAATDNSQLMILALATVQTFSALYEFDEIIVEIDQPQHEAVRRAEYKVADLLLWAEQLVKPRAELAWEGKGQFVPGDHCSKGYCKARFSCKARLERAVLTTENVGELKDALVTDERLAEILPTIPEAIRVLQGMLQWATKQVVEEKAGWTTMKLVRGRSRRKVNLPTDEIAERLGVEEHEVVQPIGITALEKLAGGKKKLLTALGDEAVVRLQAALTLVPATDARMPWAPERNAEDDFDDESDES